MNWLVCYRVKFSEQWCADECRWVEESGVVDAKTATQARRAFRGKLASDYQRIIVGRHVETRRAKP